MRAINLIVAVVVLTTILGGAAKETYPEVANCVGTDGGKFTLPKLVKRSLNADYTVQYYPKTGRVEYCSSVECFDVPLGTVVFLDGTTVSPDGVVSSEINTVCK